MMLKNKGKQRKTEGRSKPPIENKKINHPPAWCVNQCIKTYQLQAWLGGSLISSKKQALSLHQAMLVAGLGSRGKNTVVGVFSWVLALASTQERTPKKGII